MTARPPFTPRPDAPPAPDSGALAWPPERKLRLFACGCCRQWWDTLAPVCRRAVAVAERFADGQARVAELASAWRACREAERLGLPGAPRARTTELVHRVAAAVFTPGDAVAVAADLRPWRGDSGDNDEVDARCAQVRADVFGPPGAAAVRPAWVTPVVRALAGGMYKSREFDAMPALADALAAAGCDDRAALAHCRDATRPHVRGCWVVDGILRKG